MEPSVSNVLSVYNHISLDSYRFGMTWYNDAHNFAASLDSNVSRAAGVIAAMSPLSGWSNNMRTAQRIYAGETTGLGLSKNVAKAIAILNGSEPLDILGGDKVRAFYSTILEPDNADALPVIDRHAHDIAVGARTPDKFKGKGNLKGRRYLEFARVYQDAARIIGIGAPQLQAITWVEWRRQAGIVWYG